MATILYASPMEIQCGQCGRFFSRRLFPNGKLEAISVFSKRKECSMQCYGLRKRIDSRERFFKFVRKTDSCWFWVGQKSEFGYGQFWNNGKVSAHRFSYQLHKGEIPKGLCILHDCGDKDNRDCVNPEHLRIGTQKENAVDRDRKSCHRR